ncbi:hypothetical protein OESDEN_24809 [Oesophagostomum dentatum]|uniref:Laminin IV type A domain-containing protein n=1 Tax=Oesophagostomum dentatum TaxID=61180 RepID=A0A0B1RWX9_OESDE|nr:hypothetical protein OESDEN_24809 [Oesophagostomum dentatum]
MSSHPQEGPHTMSSDADVRLYGNNMTAEFWAPEQPANPEEAFNVRVKLLPENFLLSNGQPITRADLMMLLHSLQNITIKASYFSNPKSAQLVEFGLEVAGENNVLALRLTAVQVVNTALLGITGSRSGHISELVCLVSAMDIRDHVTLIQEFASTVNTAPTETTASSAKKDTMEMRPMAVHTLACLVNVHSRPQITSQPDVR